MQTFGVLSLLLLSSAVPSTVLSLPTTHNLNKRAVSDKIAHFRHLEAQNGQRAHLPKLPTGTTLSLNIQKPAYVKSPDNKNVDMVGNPPQPADANVEDGHVEEKIQFFEGLNQQPGGLELNGRGRRAAPATAKSVSESNRQIEEVSLPVEHIEEPQSRQSNLPPPLPFNGQQIQIDTNNLNVGEANRQIEHITLPIEQVEEPESLPLPQGPNALPFHAAQIALQDLHAGEANRQIEETTLPIAQLEEPHSVNSLHFPGQVLPVIGSQLNVGESNRQIEETHMPIEHIDEPVESLPHPPQQDTSQLENAANTTPSIEEPKTAPFALPEADMPDNSTSTDISPTAPTSDGQIALSADSSEDDSQDGYETADEGDNMLQDGYDTADEGDNHSEEGYDTADEGDEAGYETADEGDDSSLATLDTSSEIPEQSPDTAIDYHTADEDEAENNQLAIEDDQGADTQTDDSHTIQEARQQQGEGEEGVEEEKFQDAIQEQEQPAASGEVQNTVTTDDNESNKDSDDDFVDAISEKGYENMQDASTQTSFKETAAAMTQTDDEQRDQHTQTSFDAFTQPAGDYNTFARTAPSAPVPNRVSFQNSRLAAIRHYYASVYQQRLLSQQRLFRQQLHHALLRSQAQHAYSLSRHHSQRWMRHHQRSIQRQTTFLNRRIVAQFKNTWMNVVRQEQQQYARAIIQTTQSPSAAANQNQYCTRTGCRSL
jgi:hypothetical protein